MAAALPRWVSVAAAAAWSLGEVVVHDRRQGNHAQAALLCSGTLLGSHVGGRHFTGRRTFLTLIQLLWWSAWDR